MIARTERHPTTPDNGHARERQKATAKKTLP